MSFHCPKVVIQCSCIVIQTVDIPPAPFLKQLLFIYVVVNFLSRVFFVFLLFLGMLMYANEVETKEK